MIKQSFFVSIVLAMGFVVPVAYGGVIDQQISPSISTVTTTYPDNGYVGFSDTNINSVSRQVDFSSLKPIDLTFKVKDSTGITQYDFSAPIFNSSTTDWKGLSIQLGLGQGTNFLPAQDKVLDLNDNPVSEPPFYEKSPTKHTSSLLLWSNSSLSMGAQTMAFFSINLANSTDGTVPAADMSGSDYLATLRFTPVPEPAAWLLLLCGMAGFMVGAGRPGASGSRTRRLDPKHSLG